MPDSGLRLFKERVKREPSKNNRTMKTNSAISGLVLALLCLAEGTASAAIVTLFSDRSAWQTGSGGGSGDIFDDLNSGTVTRSAFVISGTSLAFFPNANAQTSINGSGYVRFLLDPTTDGVLTFSAPITALGYDFNPQNFNLGVTVSVAIDGNPATSYNLPATDVNGFIGFVSDTPFTSFVITTAASEAWHGVDNVEAFSVTPVPEPSTSLAAALLLLIALQSLWKLRQPAAQIGPLH